MLFSNWQERARLIHHVIEERAPRRRYGGINPKQWKRRGVARNVDVWLGNNHNLSHKVTLSLWLSLSLSLYMWLSHNLILYMWLSHNLTFRVRLRRMTGSSSVRRTFRRMMT
ncbi:hypothetical protein A2U01_0062417, partial [Trifolium medium]|nr:hypothetical protein [Trifolium medium]